MTLSSARKGNVLGTEVSATDYDEVVDRVVASARAGERLAVAATAVHGIMCGVLDPRHRFRMNRHDVVAPDGQPVRWALNLLHGARLRERVYGPELMLRICAAAAREGLPICLYGNRPEVLQELSRRLQQRFAGLEIAACRPSLLRRSSAREQAEIIADIRASGAKIVFVGLGCPRQEIWTYENADALAMPVIAVGAAFDFHAGARKQAPAWLQRRGLEWAFRLWEEPGRLWRRYLYLNPAFVALLAGQWLRLCKFRDRGLQPVESENHA